VIPHRPLEEQMTDADQALQRLIAREDRQLDPDVVIILRAFSAVLHELAKYKWAPGNTE